MSNSAPSRGRSPFATAALVVVGVACLIAVIALQRHQSHPAAARPSDTASVTLNVPSPTDVSSSSPAGHTVTPPAPYQASALALAKADASRFIVAYHSSSYTDVRPTAQPNAAKPYITAAMYARMIARLPQPGQQDSGDAQYVKQLVAEQRVVYGKVDSIGIASGDGEGLPKDQIPLVAYFHTTTYTISDSSGVRTADQPTHLTMVLQNGHWLVSTADGI